MWENVSEYHLILLVSCVGVLFRQENPTSSFVCKMHLPAQKSQVNTAEPLWAQSPFYIHLHNIRAQRSSCFLCALHAQNVSGERGIHRLTYAPRRILTWPRVPPPPAPADQRQSMFRGIFWKLRRSRDTCIALRRGLTHTSYPYLDAGPP